MFGHLYAYRSNVTVVGSGAGDSNLNMVILADEVQFAGNSNINIIWPMDTGPS